MKTRLILFLVRVMHHVRIDIDPHKKSDRGRGGRRSGREGTTNKGRGYDVDMSAVASPRGRQIRLLGLVGVKKTRKKKSQGMVKRKGGREGVDLAKGTQGSS